MVPRKHRAQPSSLRRARDDKPAIDPAEHGDIDGRCFAETPRRGRPSAATAYPAIWP
jgi:hypothetical protein